MGMISNLFLNVYIFSLDAVLTILNLITPKLPVGQVVPRGHPGHGGKWPEYIAPKEGDSRCACPALNAMANHGILPRDGKNISFVEMNHKIRTTFNFGPTFCRSVPNTMADYLHKSYAKDRLDLSEISTHNAIEHDASLTREDTALVPDQGPPSITLCQGLIDSATGKDPEGKPILTIADLSRYSSKRRTEARQTNKDFSLDFKHKMFGSSNASTLLTIFGGRVEDLKPFLLEERIPDKWESRVRSRFGLTFLTFNKTVFKVERGIQEGKQDEPAPAPAAAEV